MTTTRKAIRHAVRDLLAAQPALTGRVFASRNYPVSEKKLPVVLVYTERDVSEQVTETQEQHTLDVVVRVVVPGDADEGVDDQLDDLCTLVTATIAAAIYGWLTPMPTLTDLVENMVQRETNLAYRGDDGQQDLLAAEITFAASYSASPTAEFDQLGIVSVSFDMASPRNDPPTPIGPDGQIDARADIVLPT